MKRLSLLALIMLSGLFLAISCKEPAPAPEPIPEPDPVLETKDFMIISWEGGIYSTDIEYNTDFDVTIDAESQPWVKFIQTKATSHGELEFRFAANDCYSSRVGKATVKDKKGKADPIEITFIQEEKKISEADADIYSLGVTPGELPFKQEEFVWKVHPRYDYSKLYMNKLFLCMANYDPEYMGIYKMRDNGTQTVNMTFEQALEVIKGMDALSPGLQKIIYLVGWQYLGHDSKYPAFFEGNEALKRPGDSNGRTAFNDFKIEGRRVTLTLAQGQMVIFSNAL